MLLDPAVVNPVPVANPEPGLAHLILLTEVGALLLCYGSTYYCVHVISKPVMSLFSAPPVCINPCIFSRMSSLRWAGLAGIVAAVVTRLECANGQIAVPVSTFAWRPTITVTVTISFSKVTFVFISTAIVIPIASICAAVVAAVPVPLNLAFKPTIAFAAVQVPSTTIRTITVSLSC